MPDQFVMPVRDKRQERIVICMQVPRDRSFFCAAKGLRVKGRNSIKVF